MYKVAEENMVICPYNRYHVISKLRIQKHIFKCKQQYPDVKLATCFYNYSHKVKPENLLEHYEVCPNKARVEGARYYDNPPDFVRSRYGPFSCSDRLSSCSESSNLRISPANSDIESDEKRLYRYEESVNSPPDLNGGNAEEDFETSSSDSDLEPLPLPKTTSKAFTNCEVSSKSNDISMKSHVSSQPLSKPKNFGRGTQFFSEPMESLLEALNKDLQNKRVESDFGSVTNLLSASSEFSEVVDDSTTLKSESVILFDSDDESIAQDFDKKIAI